MTKLQQHWPMQCQWNTERVSHFHQGSQHWESWNSQKLGHHHRGQTRSAYQATALDNWGVSPQRQDTERMSSYRFRYNNDGPWNASGTRSAYPTVTRVANIRSPGTPKIGASPQRRDTVRVSSYRFRYTPASPCNASGTRSACPTATRVASISPTKGQQNRGTCRNGNNIMAETHNSLNTILKQFLQLNTNSLEIFERINEAITQKDQVVNNTINYNIQVNG